MLFIKILKHNKCGTEAEYGLSYNVLHSTNPRIRCTKCDMLFRVPKKIIDSIISPHQTPSKGVSHPHPQLYKDLDEETVKQMILNQANEGLSPSIVRSAIDYLIKVKGDNVDIEIDEIDMELFKKHGNAIKTGI